MLVFVLPLLFRGRWPFRESASSGESFMWSTAVSMQI
jgi:hypothetical protein